MKGTFSRLSAYLANVFTRFLIVFIPLSSDAFNNIEYSCQLSPKIDFAMIIPNVVFPVPGDPANNRCGIADEFFIIGFSLLIVDS
uniref:Uncharacterized protein n=1 Tax=uncultured marine thaumarchaeote AD1000_100_C06 TaxID=1455887 RepID=A0A075FHT8_9ARCH|nr:hypothetical protein [uncultured marine thaumarchaeote AD1000_100_C06]